MKKILPFTLSLLLAGSSTIHAQPANNSIFFGGVADGWTVATNGNASNAIFLGGGGNGWSVKTNHAISNAVFLGGSGNGWAVATNNAVPNSIFTGSAGDGWSVASNNAVPNSIFTGSAGDGWSVASNGALANAIFGGGGGDGWHAQTTALIPVPLRLLSFTAQKCGNTQVCLNWQTAEEQNASHFDVQRSVDGIRFTTIQHVPAKNQALNAYSLVDIVSGDVNKLFYRIRQVDKDEKSVYSFIQVVSFTNSNLVYLHPNPVISQLGILGWQHVTRAVISDATGKQVLNQLVHNSFLQVNTLPGGVYTITLLLKNGHTIIEKFIKQ